MDLKKDLIVESEEEKTIKIKEENKKKPVKKKKEVKDTKQENNNVFGNYIVEAGLLNVRRGPGFNFDNLKFNEFPEKVKKNIISKFNKPKDAIVNGTILEIKEVSGKWGKCDFGWVCLDFCKKQGE